MSAHHHRIGFVAVAALALATFVAAAALFSLKSDAFARVPSTAVALVNGTAITAEDLDLRFSQILPLTSYHGRVVLEQLLPLKRAALDELVLDELIFREARALGRRPSPAAVEAELAAAKARFESPEAYSRALLQNGLDEGALRARLSRDVLVRESRDSHASVKVTDDDIAAYYRENGARFLRPERVHLRQILFRVDPGDPATAAPAQAKARATLGRLQRGEKFGELARRLSEDEYRVKDGDMGFVHRGRLDAEFEDAVFAAPLGRALVARSLYGFEVFEVLERQPPAQLTLEEARPIIAARLARDARAARLGAWKARLLASARVEIRDVELKRVRAAELPDDEFADGMRQGRRAANGAVQ